MMENFARATSNMVRTSTLSAEGCCRLQPTGKHNNRPPSVAKRMTWLFLKTCVRPNTRGHADRARGMQQGQLVGAEDVQRKGLVNNCGRLRLGSLFFSWGCGLRRRTCVQMVWSCREGSSVHVYWCTAAMPDVLYVEFAPGLPQR